MGIRNLPILDHMAKNYQERCNLAISYLATQIGRFWGPPEFSGVWAYNPFIVSEREPEMGPFASRHT